MDSEKLKKGNELLKVLASLKAIIEGVENLIGLSKEHKQQLQDTAKDAHADVQQQFNDL
jgi:hypothetical protein